MKSPRSREKRACHKINNSAALEKDVYIIRKKKGPEANGVRVQGEEKPKPQHRAKKLEEYTEHKQEGKEKRQIREK